MVGARELLIQARKALGMTQTQFGKLLHVSLRTVARLEKSAGPIAGMHFVQAARLAFPVDPALAALLAAAAGTTIAELGLEARLTPAPEPAPAATPPPALSAAQIERALVDSVLVAAAEAIDAPTKAVRAALIAAFARASELALTPEALAAALRPPSEPGTS